MRKKRETLKNNKNRTRSSSSWLQRHINDEYVYKAKLDGYRSRAAYKLLEIQKKYKVIDRNANVLDLGAAPGGWSQVVSDMINSKNIVIGVDLLSIAPIPHKKNVMFIKENFLDIKFSRIINEICIQHKTGNKFQTILSDLSPNTSGNKELDHLNIISLCEKVFKITKQFFV